MPRRRIQGLDNTAFAQRELRNCRGQDRPKMMERGFWRYCIVWHPSSLIYRIEVTVTFDIFVEKSTTRAVVLEIFCVNRDTFCDQLDHHIYRLLIPSYEVKDD